MEMKRTQRKTKLNHDAYIQAAFVGKKSTSQDEE